MIRILRRAAAVAALALLVTPAAAEAQGIGVKGGLLYSTFSFDDVEDVIDSSSGWQAGLFFGSGEPGLKLMAEINFLRKKGELNGDDIYIDYLQVPVLARINFGNDNAVGYIIAGPNFDVKIGEDDNITLFDEYEGFDIGLTAGAGVEISRFIIEGRGTWGFRNVAKDFMASDLKTRSFAILAGFRFN